AREDERLVEPGDLGAGALGKRPPCPLLRGPIGDEELASLLDQGERADLRLLAVLQVARDRDFPPDLGAADRGGREQRDGPSPKTSRGARDRLPYRVEGDQISTGLEGLECAGRC